MESLFNFIEYMCNKYSIDESHGLKHARGTFKRANDILYTLDNVKEDEARVALYSAALHDTCDSKYTNVELASAQISTWLLEQGWINEEVDALIGIITTMSYSKLRLKSAGGQPVYPNHGKWQRAYHVARHADLLEGYIVARCFLYNMHIYPNKSDEEHWIAVRALFDRRVFRYVEDGWITFPAALKMVPALEKEAHRCFETKSLDWLYI